MVLKILDCEDMKHESSVKDSWTYIDNIGTARVTYDEDEQETVISCTFNGSEDVITIAVKYLAILMSDAGGIIDKITCKAAERDDECTTLQQALLQCLIEV